MLTPEEQAELEALEKEFSQQVAPSGILTPEEQVELSQLEDEFNQPENAEPEEKTFMSRFNKSKDRRLKKWQENVELYDRPSSAAAANVGNLLALGMEAAGAGVAEGAEKFYQIQHPTTQRGLRNIGSDTKRLTGFLGGKVTDEQKEKTATVYNKFSDVLSESREEHPKAWGMADSAANTALAFAGGLPKTLTGSAVKGAAEGMAKTRGKKFLGDLVSPIDSKAARTNAVGNTEIATQPFIGKLMQKEVVKLTPKEKNMAIAVKSVDGVSPKKTYQHNYNLITDAVKKEDINLKAQLRSINNRKNNLLNKKNTGVKLNTNEVKELDALLKTTHVTKNDLEDALLDGWKNAFDEYPVLKGSENNVDFVVKQALKAIDEVEPSPEGVLRARQILDKIMKKATANKAGKTVFDDATLNTLTNATSSIRNSLNGLLFKKAGSVKAKKSLNRSHNLLNSMDRVKPKAAAQPKTMLKRQVDKLKKAIPSGTLIPMSMLTAGGIASSPTITGAILGGVLGAKALSNPKVAEFVVRRLGNVVSAGERAIRTDMLYDTFKQKEENK